MRENAVLMLMKFISKKIKHLVLHSNQIEENGKKNLKRIGRQCYKKGILEL